MISPTPSITPSPNTTDILLTELGGGNAQVAAGVDSPAIQGGIAAAAIAVALVVAGVASQFLRSKKADVQKQKRVRATRSPMNSDTLTPISTGESIPTNNPIPARPVGGPISVGPITRASMPSVNHAANLQMFAAPKRAGVPVRNPITSAAMKHITRTGASTIAARALNGESIQERAQFGAQQVRQTPRTTPTKPTTVIISADGQHINPLKTRAAFQAMKPTTK
jgi:hypothetical protein